MSVEIAIPVSKHNGRRREEKTVFQHHGQLPFLPVGAGHPVGNPTHRQSEMERGREGERERRREREPCREGEGGRQ